MWTYPQHRISARRTAAPCERLNTKEVKRRADVVGIFANKASIIRLIGAVPLEQNDVAAESPLHADRGEGRPNLHRR
jgi:transposase-like protein